MQYILVSPRIVELYMRRSAAFIFLLVPTLLLARPSLKISLLTKKAQSSVDTSIQIRIFKEDRSLHNFTLYYFGDTTLKDIDTGTYRIEYSTIFKRLVSHTVQISKDEEYWELLFIDTYDAEKDDFTSFLSTLQNGKSLKLHFESYGCFHWETQDIKISLMNGKYVATLYPEKLVRDGKKRGKTITKTLTQQDVNSIKKLEKFVLAKASPGGGSTETTSYSFEVNGIVWVFNLDEESRKPFYNLRNTSFTPK